MKKIFFFLSITCIANYLIAQMPEKCNDCLKKLVQSSSHYKKRFGNKNIFLDKKWNADASSDGYNLTYTIYYENIKTEAYNRVITYQLNGATKKLSVKDTFSKYNSFDVKYNKNLLIDVFKYCSINNILPGKAFTDKISI